MSVAATWGSVQSDQSLQLGLWNRCPSKAREPTRKQHHLCGLTRGFLVFMDKVVDNIGLDARMSPFSKELLALEAERDELSKAEARL